MRTVLLPEGGASAVDIVPILVTRNSTATDVLILQCTRSHHQNFGSTASIHPREAQIRSPVFGAL